MSSILPISRDNNNTQSFLNKNSINQDPDSFRLMMEQMTNSNLNQLFANSQSDSGQQALSGFDGFSFSSPSDPLTSDNQWFDPNFMIPPIGLNHYKMNSTLNKLAQYTDVTETLRWFNVEVSYDDPKTGKAKKGLVKKVYIQNVSEPQILLDNGDKIDFSKIKEILGSEKDRKESANV